MIHKKTQKMVEKHSKIIIIITFFIRKKKKQNLHEHRSDSFGSNLNET